MKIAVIGKGNVGTSLGTGLARAGHDVRYGHRDPEEPVYEAAQWGEVVLLAVPHSSVRDTLRSIGNAADGKTLIDVTNALTTDMKPLPLPTSASEEIQKILPRTHVVKAFNTVFAQNQNSGKLGNEKLTAFVAGNDAKARQTVMRLAQDIGFDPVDTGELTSARYLESMAILLINLGYGQKMGTNIGYRLVKG